jgi:hypothetical protein
MSGECVGTRRGGLATQCIIALTALLLVQSVAFAQAIGTTDTHRYALAGLAFGSGVANGNESDWEFEVTPYLWAAGLDGNVGIRDRTADVDVSFRKLLKHLDGAIMVTGEARHGPWGFGIDLIYVNVSDQSGTPGPLSPAPSWMPDRPSSSLVRASA